MDFIKLANGGLSIAKVKKGDEISVEEFLSEMKPMIDYSVNKYYGSGVNRDILESKAESLALKSLNTFDDSKGTNYKTHVNNHLRGLYREVNKLQGISRLPENKKLEYRTNKDDAIYNKKEMLNSGLEGDHISISGNEKNIDSVKRELYKHLNDLSPKEREMVEHLYGMSGKKETTGNKELAKILGVSQSRLSDLKKSTGKKIAPGLVKGVRGG